ncbi:C13 family peptidase [Pseudomonas sp. N040]|uniref:C13 family peptidase n=1 Tax=Pseudomonas sp. N040 TaxID=2785325 RepID=UPI0018A2EE23|nr:C13 family peptidase [Pseudomonas sp. N040]MBF7730158.1 caspase family protein [Pseudomonas sp. N040]MBW7013800.1 caspase family protein [Pseudomonas sp. N040]
MKTLLPLALLLLTSACGEGAPPTPANLRLADGALYQGELVGGLLHGTGRLDYANGSWLAGHFQDGQAEGPGEWHGAAGEHYVGGFHQGLFDGQGRLQRVDGSSFQGRFARGQPEGEGLRVDADGARLSGRFSGGQLNGHGSYLGADGEHYSGDFRADQFHGQGRYTSADGAVWSGTFREDALEGPGELHDSDGSVYRGHFKNWEYDGQGVLSTADGRSAGGEWRQGRRVRDESGAWLADPLELALLDQGALLERALAAVPASTPAIELYSLTVAGDGNQSVFLREVDYVNRLLAGRFAAHGQISLVNHREHLADRPLATRESIARAVQALASKSGPEDVLFIYLSSHGSPEHELALQQPRLQLADLPASELAELLRPLQQRYKVLVVSACFSGGFVAPLQDAKTLIMTAARADRVSFGCSEEADFTYFGRALFAEALQQTDDLEQAFRLALAAVAAREQDAGFEPSEPQLSAAPAVLAQWRKLRAGQSAKPALAAAGSPPADASGAARKQDRLVPIH